MLVQAAILVVCANAIPVNKTKAEPAQRVANLLQGPVPNSAAEEFDDDQQSTDIRLNVDQDVANAKITLDWLTSKLRGSAPNNAPSITMENGTTGEKNVLLLTPDVLETLETYMESEEDLTEAAGADSTVDSAVGESQFVVRLARALKHLRHYGKVPETYVVNSVEMIEHTNGESINTIDEFPQGQFATTEKPSCHPHHHLQHPIDHVIAHPSHDYHYHGHRLHHFGGHKKGVSRV